MFLFKENKKRFAFSFLSAYLKVDAVEKEHPFHSSITVAQRPNPKSDSFLVMMVAVLVK